MAETANTRREFLKTASAAALTSAALGSAAAAAEPAGAGTKRDRVSPDPEPAGQSPASLVDFRYSPLQSQHVICLPDETRPGLIGERGDLRYGNPGGFNRDMCFPEIVAFRLNGMEADTAVQQRLESPGVPIVHTRIDRAEASLELTTFATLRTGRRPGGQRDHRGAAQDEGGSAGLPARRSEHAAQAVASLGG